MAQTSPVPPFDIRLADTLSGERIIASLQAGERAGVIAELIERLDQLNLISPDSRGGLLAALLEKEHIHTTGIGSGVAIPHCHSSAVCETLFIFGRSLKGVDFNAPDNAPVHFVLLYIVPEDRHLLHLQTLRAVARNFLGTRLRQELMHAADAFDILSAFRKHAVK